MPLHSLPTLNMNLTADPRAPQLPRVHAVSSSAATPQGRRPRCQHPPPLAALRPRSCSPPSVPCPLHCRLTLTLPRDPRSCPSPPRRCPARPGALPPPVLAGLSVGRGPVGPAAERRHCRPSLAACRPCLQQRLHGRPSRRAPAARVKSRLHPLRPWAVQDVHLIPRAGPVSCATRVFAASSAGILGQSLASRPLDAHRPLAATGWAGPAPRPANLRAYKTARALWSRVHHRSFTVQQRRERRHETAHAVP